MRFEVWSFPESSLRSVDFPDPGGLRSLTVRWQQIAFCQCHKPRTLHWLSPEEEREAAGLQAAARISEDVQLPAAAPNPAQQPQSTLHAKLKPHLSTLGTPPTIFASQNHKAHISSHVIPFPLNCPQSGAHLCQIQKIVWD